MNLPNIFYWLATTRLDGIGPARLWRWMGYFGSLNRLFTASAPELQSARLTPEQINIVQNVDWRVIENDLLWAEKTGCHLVTYESEWYPRLLREIHHPPLILFVKGDITLLSKPQLAIVGSRNPTISGREHAEEFAAALAQAGLVITSGLACGIDSASHRGALNSKGKTLAVCGTGLKYLYPSSNKKLAEDIISNGAIISEFPPETKAQAKHFPMRNRIISGMSLGVLVVEAALRSGSLITARYAVDQGREVFALPGSINNPLARGCHQLIRQGAKLIETAEDILVELGALKAVLTPAPGKDPSPDLDTEHLRILDQIGYEITTLDAIIMRSGLTAAKVSSMLLSLELMGYVKNGVGGYVKT